MLNIQKLNESALACLGWPYASPGSNDQHGIDCSGLFVKMYRDQGAAIAHGSNTIFRDYCEETGKLTSASQLKAGMAVFKCKAWTDADRSNRWYGTAPGNISHIGYVLSANPLRIIHASSEAGCVTIDEKIGRWAYWGELKDANYSGGGENNPHPEPLPVSKTMYVYAENGKPVNMRRKPDLHAALIERVPVGASVTWQKEDVAGWAYIQYHGMTGWMMDCFLVQETPGHEKPEPPTSVPDEPAPVPPEEPIPAFDEMTVWAENGKPVKLRQRPSTSCTIYDELPVGTKVTLVRYGAEWCQVNYMARKGWYMMTKFLTVG